MNTYDRIDFEPGRLLADAHTDDPSELHLAIIRTALAHGWHDANAAALAEDAGLPAEVRAEGYTDYADALADYATEATDCAQDWLNDNVVPEGYHLAYDTGENGTKVWGMYPTTDYDVAEDVSVPEGLTAEGEALYLALHDPRLDTSAVYNGMGDPLYVLGNPETVLVVYGSSDTGFAARHAARELKDTWPVEATVLTNLADALEPMLERVSAAAEDANLETDGDPYREAGGVACEWMHQQGLGTWVHQTERGWSRGPRVIIKRKGRA